jgi:nucleotide-binding universal stress UspA family protein
VDIVIAAIVEQVRNAAEPCPEGNCALPRSRERQMTSARVKEANAMKILIAYDGSSYADAAIRDLRRAGLPNDVEALVVCVADGHLPPAGAGTGDGSEPDSWRARLADAKTLAENAAQRIGSDFPGWRISSDALWGPAARVFLHTCEWWNPDLLVMGSHGRSAVARLLLGSVSLELVHKAPCSVRITRTAELVLDSEPVRIIVGTDGSPEAASAVRAVAGRCWPEKTEVQVLAAMQQLSPVPMTPLEARTYRHEPTYSIVHAADERTRLHLENIVAESANALRRGGLLATSSIVDGNPNETLLAAARLFKADAIFVGAQVLGRIDRVRLGSVSSHIVTHAHCTVEVVRESRRG